MAQLGELAKLERELDPEATQILVISPDTHEQDRQLKDTLQKTKDLRPGYPLLSDSDHRVIDRYGILNPRGEGIPHPAVYVVDLEGLVRWKYLETDYKIRATNEEILAALNSLE